MKPNIENEEIFVSLITDGYLSVDKNGKCINEITGNEIGIKPNKNGYKEIGWKLNGKKKSVLVHRLVHILYNDGFTEEQPICNHKDGNKWNNHYSNLERCSFSENSKHAYKTGLKFISEKEKQKLSELYKGEKGVNAKLTNEDVEVLKERYKEGGCTHRSLAKELNMHHSTIGSFLRKETFI